MFQKLYCIFHEYLTKDPNLELQITKDNFSVKYRAHDVEHVIFLVYFFNNFPAGFCQIAIINQKQALKTETDPCDASAT